MVYSIESIGLCGVVDKLKPYAYERTQPVQLSTKFVRAAEAYVSRYSFFFFKPTFID